MDKNPKKPTKASRLTRPQRQIIALIFLNIILLTAALFWNWRVLNSPVAVAVAKGKQMMEMSLKDGPSYNLEHIKQIAESDIRSSVLAESHNLEFVNAVPLGPGESRRWQDKGCAQGDCYHVTYYNLTAGGTAEVIVNSSTNEIIDRWQNPEARPGGSIHILDRAYAIAAASDEVQSILGNIGAADPAMVPMSAFLIDDPCRDEWCVDLTFHDPEGSGRIVHVFINMERNEVARTFYSRGRANRSAAKPIQQRYAYTDGCHEQYGWEVCWEMTANDGVNFQDATYQGTEIFSSVKIGQVEAWYPSWPGGYRDEIGFSSTVPPFGDTIVDDFDDGFEVRQMFTEFTTWPNCICCYRYEESIRFHEDGEIEFKFISHGPGCDDPSVYRPFWRIDLDLDGPEDDQVWLWDSGQWEESLEEFETFPLTMDLSPSSFKLATFDGDLGYHWQLIPADPLGLDAAYLFLLQFNDNEGDGPILTGPGDTYIPPRQWIDGDDLSGENIVLWYVPLLTQKKDPYWCMPDPDPEFSPCDAVLLGKPAAELDIPEPTPTPTTEPTKPATVDDGEPTPIPTATIPPTATWTPTPTTTPAPTSTPRPIGGKEVEEIILNSGCGSCHEIGDLGEAHKVGPDLSDIGLIAGDRVLNMSAKEFIHESIIDPNAYIPEECPNGPCLANIMPRDYDARLTPEQIDLMVAFLLEQKEPPAEGDELTASIESTPAPKAFPAPKNTAGGSADTFISPIILVQILVLSLVFLISLLVFFMGKPDKEKSD